MGGPGEDAAQLNPLPSENKAEALTNISPPSENMKQVAESRGMTMEQMRSVAESRGMTMEQMRTMGEAMGLSTEEMVDMMETMHQEDMSIVEHMEKSMDQTSFVPDVDNSKYIESNQKAAQLNIDPTNPPKVATHNFIDLEPFIRITKIRSAYGHNYNYGSTDHDPTGKSCSSMKHYFDAYTDQQRWDSSFGSYDTRGNVKFYSPVDGDLYGVVPKEIEQGTEYQFYISPKESSQIIFTFHHVDLFDEFIDGGSVTSGQHLGYIMRPNGQGEIAVAVSSSIRTEYISFFDVMTDEVFEEYQERGITSRSQMTIPRQEREENPIPCTLNDGSGGKFYSESGNEEEFQEWQNGPDNWIELT